MVMQQGGNRKGGTWCLQPRDESVGVEWVSGMMRNSKFVRLDEVKGDVVWKRREVRDDVGGGVRGVGGDEVPFANEREGDDVGEEIDDGAGGEERK